MTPDALHRPTGEPGRLGGSGSHALAGVFAAELLTATEGRLGASINDLHWFRTDWQRGGAATATGRYRIDDGATVEVVVKVPVPLREARWLRRLGTAKDAPVPQLFASGDALGPYDFVWIVIERIPHGPLATRWHPDHARRIGDAAARFHQLALATPVDQPPRNEEWESLLLAARDRVKDPSFPERSRWSAALKDFSRRAERIIERWTARRPIGWIHGDLHPANAMSREAGDHGAVCLIDFAEVRAGHWLEDAIYFERLLWTRPDRIDPLPAKCSAESRKRLGLENGDWPPLAAARRLLLAATAPGFRGEHHAPFLSCCLTRLEQGLRELR